MFPSQSQPRLPPPPLARQILHNYLEGCPLHHLAEAFGLSIPALLDIVNAPDFQLALDGLQSAGERRAQLLTTLARPAAIQLLLSLLTDHETTPTDRRRAATA